ncbi:cupin domain-containing protein [Candidatus Woesearchaeota archaeon]|nr:cupin domain-containing protein [Candidatus Woesearchaeota archaeon]
MKKKTMQTIFVLLFIAGVIAGYLLPGDLKALANKSMSKQAMANVFDVPKKLGQLDMENEYFKYTVLASVETGSIELLRIDDKIPMHMHPKENHFVYIFKGRAKGTIGSTTAEVSPGQLVAIPAGVPHSFERVGDSPVEVILFSSPPFVPADIVWLDNR